MKDITIAIGMKENIGQDVYTLARKWVDNPEIIIVTGKDIRNMVIEKASTLFIGENLILVLLDPEKALIEEIKEQLQALSERIHIIIYTTTQPKVAYKHIEGNTVVMERNNEKRIEDRVRDFIRKYGKKMTHEGLKLLTERIKDESILESELMKLVNYIGDRREIKSKDVLSIVTETHEENLTVLFEALIDINKKETLYIFENLLANGLHILAIHSYLVRQVRLLLQAKDMEEVFKAGSEYDIFLKTFHKWKESLELKPSEKKQYLPFQNPYYAYKLSKASQKITRKNLISFLDTLTAFDVNVKKGTKYDRIHLEQGLLGA